MKNIGIHNPELSTYFLDKITSETGMYFEDTSYSNDATDSIGVGTYLQIFLANSGLKNDPDKDRFSTFEFKFENLEDEHELSFDSLEGLIEYLQCDEGRELFSEAISLVRAENEEAVQDEKRMVLRTQFYPLFEEILNDVNIDTTQMLKRISDRAEHLIITDF